MAKQITSIAKIAALCLVLWTTTTAAQSRPGEDLGENIGSLTNYLGTGTKAGSEDGEGGMMNRPSACVVVNDEALLIADSVNNAIRGVDLSGRSLQTVIGQLSNPGFDILAGTTARVGTPMSLVVDEAANVYFTDYGNNMVIKATGTAATLSIVAGQRDRGYANGAGATASFNGTSNLAWGAGGELFVSERDGNRVRRIGSDGVVSLVAGSEDSEAAFADDTGAAARFSEPNGLAYHEGTLFVADTKNQRIRAIDVSSGEVTTVAGTGTLGHVDGAGLQSSFVEPYGLTVNGGFLYIADKGNNVIRRMSLEDHTVETVVGNLEAGWTTRSIAREGKLYAPQGVCFSSTRMYITGDHSVSYIVMGGQDTPRPTTEAPATEAPETPAPTTEAPETTLAPEDGADDDDVANKTKAPKKEKNISAATPVAAVAAAVIAALLTVVA
jgi:sugar lactone lactonase YvrE